MRFEACDGPAVRHVAQIRRAGAGTVLQSRPPGWSHARSLVSRSHAHKSVLAGLVQAGARPLWLKPRWDARFGVAHGLDAAVVEDAVEESGAKALWALHPTYYGTTADIAALASRCKRFDARLLVYGAHSNGPARAGTDCTTAHSCARPTKSLSRTTVHRYQETPSTSRRRRRHYCTISSRAALWGISRHVDRLGTAGMGRNTCANQQPHLLLQSSAS